jgi:DNA-binding response OmpR family regulator
VLDQPATTKVLLIDDDPSLNNLLKIGLAAFGYECIAAENGKAAQQVLQTFRPDLMLVDLFMPVMDGLAFIQWLRETAGDSTPVLVFTSLNDVSVAEEALKSGANSFIGKPLHMKGLVEAMKRLAPV